MDFVALYTQTAGRISRKTWWLGVVGLFVLSLILSIVIAVPAAVGGFAETATGEAVLEIILLAILFVPTRALTLKRLHDRSRPENLFWVFLAPSLLSPALKITGLSGAMQTSAFMGTEILMYQPNAIGHAVNALIVAVSVWALVELGVLKGDAGANAHGPDPLAPTGPGAAPSSDGTVTTPE